MLLRIVNLKALTSGVDPTFSELKMAPSKMASVVGNAIIPDEKKPEDDESWHQRKRII